MSKTKVNGRAKQAKQRRELRERFAARLATRPVDRKKQQAAVMLAEPATTPVVSGV